MINSQSGSDAPGVDTLDPSSAFNPPAPAGHCTLVIFGAAGDLTSRLLMPALYNLARTHLLSDNLALVGVDRAPLDTEKWRAHLTAKLRGFVDMPTSEFHIDTIDEDAWHWLQSRMTYLQGDLTDADMYRRLGQAIEQVGAEHRTEGNCLFYLAVADRFFAEVIAQLGRAQLVSENAPGWRRVVIEKPFGHDLESARALNAEILKTLREDQIYRIDHFLGKETVQSIMAVRFANGLFEPIWNRNHIDHVQITVAETVGVERRGQFYEQTGCLRDMVPNHVFQLLGMIAMEPPTSFSADAFRDRKSDVFSAIRTLRVEDAARGQYAAGTVLGKPVRAYRDEPNVAPDSLVETYCALRVIIDNWRWAGVPFYLRTGKYLARRTTEIAVRFNQAPYSLFRHTGVNALGANWLVLRIQPDEGISLQFDVKRPGPTIELAPVNMDFRYKDWFAQEPNVGYETLIYDCMIGDASLFQRADSVEAGWRVVQPIIDAWREPPQGFPNYTAGSAGPATADALIARDGGRRWRPLDGRSLRRGPRL